MKFESQLYDLHDQIMDDIRTMNRDDERCCQFHCPKAEGLPKLCERCHRKLIGLREFLDEYKGKFLVSEL